MIWNSSRKVSDVMVSNEVCSSIEKVMQLFICLIGFILFFCRNCMCCFIGRFLSPRHHCWESRRRSGKRDRQPGGFGVEVPGAEKELERVDGTLHTSNCVLHIFKCLYFYWENNFSFMQVPKHLIKCVSSTKANRSVCNHLESNPILGLFKKVSITVMV